MQIARQKDTTLSEPQVGAAFRWSYEIEKLLLDECRTGHADFAAVTDQLIPTYRKSSLHKDPIQFDRRWYLPTLRDIILPELRKAHNRCMDECLYFLIWERFRFNRGVRYKEILLQDDIEEFMSLVEEAATLLLPVTLAKATYPCGIYYPAEFRIHMLDLHYARRGGMAASVNYATTDDGGIAVSEGSHKFWTIRDYTLRIRSIACIDGSLVIEGMFPNRFILDSGGSLHARLENSNGDIRIEELRETDVLPLSYFFGRAIFKFYTIKLIVPDNEFRSLKSIRFEFELLGVTHTCRIVFTRWTARLGKYQRFAEARLGAKKLSYANQSKTIYFSDSRPSFRRHVGFIACCLKYKKYGVAKLHLLYLVTRPYFGRQKIWLYFDKLYKGGDNGEYLFRYATAQRDGIHHYYIVNADSPDYRRLKKLGLNVLKFRSLRQRLVALNANKVIGTHANIPGYLGFRGRIAPFFWNLLNPHVVYIQHGLTIDYIPSSQARIINNVERYYCTSKYERENLLEPAYDYAPDQLRLTGSPRYDGLVSRPTKKILLSPTWRRSVTIDGNASGKAKSYNPAFRETPYFACFNKLINDPRLLGMLRENGYALQYLLHPTLSSQVSDFDVPDEVEILAAADDVSYEKLLCEADLLITDYSGIQFDFAYMRKPVIYFQPVFLPPAYSGGVFDYATMGFGPIVATDEELVKALGVAFEGGLVMATEYRRRADDFFAYDDRNNCQRVYEDLRSLS